MALFLSDGWACAYSARRMIRMIEIIGRLAGWRRSLLAFASGAVAALSLPPLGLWPALFVAFPVLLALLAGTPPRRWHAGFGTGWLFGLGYFAVAFHWIGFAFLVDADTYLWMMPFMVGGLAGGMAIYWGWPGLCSCASASPAWLWCSGARPFSAWWSG